MCIVASTASGDSTASQDSLDLFGTWRLDLTWGGLAGTHQTPAASGYTRLLRFDPEGTYSFFERDSANTYQIARGAFRAHSNSRFGHHIETIGPASLWLEMVGWYDPFNRLLVVLRGRDTLFAYPGGGDTFVADAHTERFIRERVAQIPPRIRPWAERPPRLVSYGDENYSLELPDSLLYSLIWMQGFHKAWDRDYPVDVRSRYHYTHYQSPAALIGDFDADGSLDVVLYMHGTTMSDTMSTVVCMFAGPGQRRTSAFITETTLYEPLRPGQPVRSYRQPLPSLYLELIPAGKTQILDGRRSQLMGDAVRVVRLDGRTEDYAYLSGRFQRIQIAK